MLTILLVCVLVPILAIISIAANQAGGVIIGIENLIARLETQWPAIQVPDWVPFRDKLDDLYGLIASKAGEIAGRVASLFVSVVSAATRGTVSFF